MIRFAHRFGTLALTLTFAATAVLGVGDWCCPEADAHACCKTRVSEADLVSRTPCCPPAEVSAPEGQGLLARAETPVSPEAPHAVALETPAVFVAAAVPSSQVLVGTRGLDTGPPPRARLQIWLA